MLNGGGAYHAAVHCAAVAAAQRQVPPPQSGDRYKARRARRSGFFVRAARAVTRSLRGKSRRRRQRGRRQRWSEGDRLGSEDRSQRRAQVRVIHGRSSSPQRPEASQHLPPTEAHVAVVSTPRWTARWRCRRLCQQSSRIGLMQRQRCRAQTGAGSARAVRCRRRLGSCPCWCSPPSRDQLTVS